jgi:hypothetical protein
MFVSLARPAHLRAPHSGAFGPEPSCGLATARLRASRYGGQVDTRAERGFGAPASERVGEFEGRSPSIGNDKVLGS